VFEKVFVIEAYGMPGVVEYLHVASSSVVRDRVTVVPAGSSPVGEPLLLTGGDYALKVCENNVRIEGLQILYNNNGVDDGAAILFTNIGSGGTDLRVSYNIIRGEISGENNYGSLPTDLTLSNAGVISGTPSAAGTYNFTVKVEDSSSPKKQATKQLSINVNEQTQPLTITTEALPDGIVGTQYSATLSASGGIPPYTWSISSGSLPNGLILSPSTGAISGTPIEQGTYNFTVQVQDADSNTAAKNLSITINPSDTTPPVRSNGSPTGELPAGTTVTLSLTTDEDATCRYSTTPGIPYASMTNTFSNTGSTSHSTTITGLSNGNTYNYYIKCIDTYNNANTDDYLISFSIASNWWGSV